MNKKEIIFSIIALIAGYILLNIWGLPGVIFTLFLGTIVYWAAIGKTDPETLTHYPWVYEELYELLEDDLALDESQFSQLKGRTRVTEKDYGLLENLTLYAQVDPLPSSDKDVWVFSYRATWQGDKKTPRSLYVHREPGLIPLVLLYFILENTVLDFLNEEKNLYENFRRVYSPEGEIIFAGDFARREPQAPTRHLMIHYHLDPRPYIRLELSENGSLVLEHTWHSDEWKGEQKKIALFLLNFKQALLHNSLL